ncbi:MAG: type I-E CRISPR-associated endoribonuclease Cas2e [Polynucleobacter sp.]|uniref:type I-E CRISPR-associated endoribonuclease Cas2e n=1 Tax=Polynucleobacter sp. TaxID=2029855 RepID=UPI00271BF62F|nr:type I-E CRISPR-associated endoribonuclease Cas2e [Polynucleobacter sp.]MDO8714013.1 type I-E CRISPR-associated endoribonuclease Cas2e [Polynucleobacter sp.]
MLVVIANDLPPAVRGRMKLWFIEPKPNVFISGVKDNVAKKVVDYLYKYCPADSGLMIFRRISKTPGYDISGIGDTKRNLTEISGLQLVVEKQNLLNDSSKIEEISIMM